MRDVEFIVGPKMSWDKQTYMHTHTPWWSELNVWTHCEKALHHLKFNAIFSLLQAKKKKLGKSWRKRIANTLIVNSIFRLMPKRTNFSWSTWVSQVATRNIKYFPCKLFDVNACVALGLSEARLFVHLATLIFFRLISNRSLRRQWSIHHYECARAIFHSTEESVSNVWLSCFISRLKLYSFLVVALLADKWILHLQPKRGWNWCERWAKLIPIWCKKFIENIGQFNFIKFILCDKTMKIDLWCRRQSRRRCTDER